LKEFKRGGTAIMLSAADRLPVVPVTISGSWRLAEKNLTPVPFGCEVRIRFGDPIDRHPDDVDELLTTVREQIRVTLEEWGEEPSPID
jgi:1-acyl-sn-glycerol-3-phosphate acyltransferase